MKKPTKILHRAYSLAAEAGDKSFNCCHLDIPFQSLYLFRLCLGLPSSNKIIEAYMAVTC